MATVVHVLETARWDQVTFAERLAIHMTMWLTLPLNSDQRITMLMTLLVDEMRQAITEDEEIDTMLGIIRRQLRGEADANDHQG